MKSLYFCSISHFVVIKITRVLSQLKKNYYHEQPLWYISKTKIYQIKFKNKLKKLIFLMLSSIFKTHGKALFLLKKWDTTRYGSQF